MLLGKLIELLAVGTPAATSALRCRHYYVVLLLNFRRNMRKKFLATHRHMDTRIHVHKDTRTHRHTALFIE